MDGTLKNKMLKRKILDASRSIKRKYLQLKLDKAENDEIINYMVKPITAPLERIEKRLMEKNTAEKQHHQLTSPKKEQVVGQRGLELKTEKKEMEDEMAKNKNPYLERYEQLKQQRRMTFPFVDYQPENEIGQYVSKKYDTDGDDDDDDDDDVFEDSNAEEISEGIYYEQYPEMARDFIKQFKQGDKHIDRTRFALQHDAVLDKWMMGKKNIDFKDGVIELDNKYKFNATPGLYELIFYKSPQTFTEEDRKNYLEMLNKTKILKDKSISTYGTKYLFVKNYILPNKKEQRAASSSSRQRKAKSKEEQASGSGLGRNHYKNLNSPHYIYWNDVNELVDRLKLLVASQNAGNTSHQNEITSILEELHEMGIIDMYV